MKSYTRFVCALGALLLVFGVGASRLNAQATAAISGTVTDTSGAAMADAQVQAKNTGTDITSTTTTDSQGRFRFPDLLIGNYDLTAVKAGFQTVTRRGITLTVGSQPVADFQLPVGAQTQTVNVEGQVSQVETQNTAVGSLVESKEMRDLPLNGRNFTQLLTLAPGVTQIPLGAPGAGSTFYGNGVKYSIAGSRPSGQAYLLDDQDMVNFWNNGPGAGGLGTALGVDAIAEFQTLTNTYSAQYGGNGAVVNASSKSGTNAFHGTAFDFLRNNKLESRNFYDNGSSAPTFRRNQFGGSIGGPIKKDKIFFFANYEGYRSTQIFTNVVTVPDQCAHQFLTSTATPGVCGAPVAQSNTPYATSLATRQAIQGAMALYPNTAFNELLAGGKPSGTGLAFVSDPNIGNENYLLGRVDYTLSDKDALFVRYVMDRADRNFTTNIPYWPELDTTLDNFVNVEERRIISARVVNLAHVGFSRTWEAANVTGSPTVSGITGNALSGPGVLAGVTVTPGTIASSGNHPLQFFGTAAGREDGGWSTGFSGVTAIGASTTLPFYLVPNKFQFGDDVIWTSGAHSIKFGGNATRLRENTWAPFIVGGNWTFPSLTAFEQGAASQVQGQVSDAQNPTSDATKDYRYWVFNIYAEDQWKVSSKLTLNIGLRYSPTTTIGETRHLMYNLLNPPFGSFVPVTQESANNPSLRNWDPRIGLAFDPFKDHKTSIRASFGMFHNVLYSRDLNYWLQPPFLTATQTAAQGLIYPNLFSNVGPGSGAISIPTNGSLSISNGDFYGVSSTPYQMQWNFNIQREVMADTVATVGYIGSHNLHMFLQTDFNHPTPCLAPGGSCFYNGSPTMASATGVPNPRLNPQYNSLQLADNLGDSNYEALQASLNRRFSHNWQAQVSYTFSKSIDNGSGTYGLDGGGISSNPLNIGMDRGLSNFNRENNFRVSSIYALPFKVKGFVGQVVNGWQLTGIFTYLSGAPANPTSAQNRVFTGTGQNTGRPNVVSGCDLYAGQQLHGLWFNPGCFALQPIGTYGNAGRDIIIGPNLWNLDSSLIKDWRVTKISEVFAVQFRAEAFNVLNHPSFQNPTTAIFQGTALNASAGVITATNSLPRQIQLALKIVF
ncbi:MAG TPA: TonB-dependent receptor [Bryobacteraceae bacterium]|nr:TonB-dependent receptor [Bryobacteraceae bacterium]